MKRFLGFILTALWVASPAVAGPKSLYLSNAWRYAKHHKLELLVDFSMVAASAADVETTVRATACPPCTSVETNPLLPAHPSRVELWAVKVPFDVGLAVVNHYTANARDENGKRILPYGIWAIPSVGWDVAQAIAARDNARRIR